MFGFDLEDVGGVCLGCMILFILEMELELSSDGGSSSSGCFLYFINFIEEVLLFVLELEFLYEFLCCFVFLFVGFDDINSEYELGLELELDFSEDVDLFWLFSNLVSCMIFEGFLFICCFG